MAKSKSSSKSESMFNGSINKDSRYFGMKKGDYTFARNAINKSAKGDFYSRISEPSNVLCTRAPFVIIGAENLEEDWWVIFSTNNTISEIGYFYSKKCEYVKLARGTCLGFKTSNLITSVSRPTYDGSFNIYFDDFGLNVSRFFNTRKFPFVQNCTTVNNCVTCVDTDVIDCDKLRLETYIQTPCLQLHKGPSIGSLLNGTYTAYISYLINGQRVSDYFTGSNELSIFSHLNANSSIELTLNNLDVNFDDYELVILSTISQKTVARKFGTYSTRQNKVTIDFIDNTLQTIDLQLLPIITPVPDRSEGMYEVGKYLTRVNPSEKFNFNYQPLANQIKSFWQSVKYPKDYYKKGGTNVGHMRDEVYSYFIRFIYNTGDKTNSFHIPGRPPGLYNWTDDNGNNAGLVSENAPTQPTINDLESPAYIPKVFEVVNTAQLTSTPNTVLPDGGIVIAEGVMGYHESTELYDDKSPEVWNSGIAGHPEFDLCGQPIRHHRFPDNCIVNGGAASTLTNHYEDGGDFIRVMGVRFENIQHPIDNYGNVIPNIAGYEILRGSRNGNKTVLFKGMLNNMFEYTIPNAITSRKGLYSNYPFNDLRPDPFISSGVDPVTYEPAYGGLQNYIPNSQVSRRAYTFHSPDTTFEKPFLGGDELKIYGALWGESRGSFLEPEGHPRHKFITDLTFMGSIVAGFAYAIAKMNGTRRIEYNGYVVDSDPLITGNPSSVGNAFYAVGTAAMSLVETGIHNTIGLQGMGDALSGNNVGFGSTVQSGQGTILSTSRSMSYPGTGIISGQRNVVYDNQNQNPGVLNSIVATLGNPLFIGYVADGSDAFIKLVQATGAWRQHAVQYQSVCNYENFAPPSANNRRRLIAESRYLDPGMQDFETNYRINHKLRNETVVLSTNVSVGNIGGAIVDVSRPPLMSTLPLNDIFKPLLLRASSHYVGYKVRLRNQYGQLDSIMQLKASTCMIPITSTTTGTIFGGDTYIGKYSEKNTLYYFDQWMNKQPDGAILNYFKHRMFEHTAFWMDTDPFDLNEFIQSIPTALGNAISGGGLSAFMTSLVTPSDKHCFDRLNTGTGVFLLKKAFMYLFNSGVRDFFVESEYNVDYRDWEDSDDKKHWPILSDLKTMFSLDNIKADNYYKFDRSLSVSFLSQNSFSWGRIYQRDYSPFLAETVFTKRKRRVLYSLPQSTSSKKDNYSVFLPLNYRDFTSDVTCIKPINKTGALIFFKTESPGLLPGVDQLETTTGTKLTIGDGSLWGRDIQPLDNSELPFQYASCQNRLSVINTPVGIFYMCVEQGEIFITNGQNLKTLSNEKIRRWLNLYLPYQLLKDFPDFQLVDNPVSGIGCQALYATDTNLAYFCKKDYRLKPDLDPSITIVYIGGNLFRVNGILDVKLGDPRFFESASWTFSWDVVEDSYVSFHDWHPDLILLGPNVFHTIKKNAIWKHNSTCQSYCNFYGVDYPFEIQFLESSSFSVNTIRNIEYYLECFRYSPNCYDRFHVLNHNFDEAVIFNSEQVSGVLRLNLNNGRNDEISLLYPKINNSSIDILFNKEEQKYRFNQFWDITRDRGEFTGVSLPIWNTQSNGYIKSLNSQNLDYQKFVEERKSFRHHNNEVLLIKRVCGNVEMIIDMALVSKLKSER